MSGPLADLPVGLQEQVHTQEFQPHTRQTPLSLWDLQIVVTMSWPQCEFLSLMGMSPGWLTSASDPTRDSSNTCGLTLQQLGPHIQSPISTVNGRLIIGSLELFLKDHLYMHNNSNLPNYRASQRIFNCLRKMEFKLQNRSDLKGSLEFEQCSG